MTNTQFSDRLRMNLQRLLQRIRQQKSKAQRKQPAPATEPIILPFPTK